jgi:hypothetical protein
VLQEKMAIGNKAPPLPAVSMAMAVQRCNTEHIARCSMSKATPEASLRIASVATREPSKTITMKKCTYFAGHFDDHGNAPVQYCTHCPMEEVQGFTRSH